FSVGLALDYNYSIFFNTIFTFFPTMTVGVFDQDISARMSLKLPQVYQHGIRQEHFNLERFWIYMGHGLYQSLICYYGVFLMTWDDANSIWGFDTDASTFSNLLASCAIIIINMFGTANWYSWSWINYFSLIASIVLFMIYLASYCTTPGTPPFGFIPSPSFFFVVVIITTLSLLPRLLIKFAQRMVYPNDIDIIQEMQKQEETLKMKGSYKESDSSVSRSGDFSSKFKDFLTKSGNHVASGAHTIPLKDAVPGIESPRIQTPVGDDGFEKPHEPGAEHRLRLDIKKPTDVADLDDRHRQSSIGQAFNEKFHKAGQFFKQLIPERKAIPEVAPVATKGSSIIYMNGNKESENTGFAFSHDPGMQDIITPMRVTLEPINENQEEHHVKRKRFPSLVPDRLRQFSRTIHTKLTKSGKKSSEQVSHPPHDHGAAPAAVAPLKGSENSALPPLGSRNATPKRSSLSSIRITSNGRGQTSGTKSHDGLQQALTGAESSSSLS
ncbi:hypothetical protein HDU91_002193, partial [Kappamyces sp. JEL0680]